MTIATSAVRQTNKSRASGTSHPLKSNDEKLVKETVSEINKIVENTVEKGYQGLLKIGRLILDRFFEGKVEKYRSHDPHKPSSLRSLSEHPDLRFNTSGLYRAINLAIQKEALQLYKIPTTGVSVSHLVELLSEKGIARKRKLLAAVVKEKLSVRQLQERMAPKKKQQFLPPTPATDIEPRPVKPGRQPVKSPAPEAKLVETTDIPTNRPVPADLQGRLHLPEGLDLLLHLDPKTVVRSVAAVTPTGKQLAAYEKSLKNAMAKLREISELVSKLKLGVASKNRSPTKKAS